jgi:phosphatidylinositol glycan class W
LIQFDFDEKTTLHDDQQALINRIDEKIIRLSINLFRSLLFIITSVAILAVDFTIFPINEGKTGYYGFSLMDIGVGFFILGHSMRVIRNKGDDDCVSSSFKSELRQFPRKFYTTIKKSSLLLIIGLLRLIVTKALSYSVSIQEYGVHWNFFFSIFFVKVSKKSSSKNIIEQVF